MSKHQENYDALVRMARRLQERGLEPLTEGDTISDRQYQFLCGQAQIILRREGKVVTINPATVEERDA